MATFKGSYENCVDSIMELPIGPYKNKQMKNSKGTVMN
jgi:hypothetical protein